MYVQYDYYTKGSLLPHLQYSPTPHLSSLLLFPSLLLSLYLKAIPEVVYHMIGLQTLYLRFNRMVQVAPNIANLQNLQMLSLRENKIREVPASIG